eukprot:CAMPEP_0202684934 /NCGR_PEP_ID=MMETSP1385-20130828/529_1 /ASSEMBLY_ACC=CAM_ASM_000861 /TAXON_ID=933848 /ORGANISM="Elphidium margaritaceum" /LENGTH=370 /DNA_ID=CAMNT_0049339161 /DNA_START=163 /DNA_END=1271 /DNA_ORIENTATION=-
MLTDKRHEKDLAFICCLSKRMQMDLVAYSLALYQRNPAAFRSLQQVFKQKCGGSAVYNALLNVIKICHVRLFLDPDLAWYSSRAIRIKDDINVYIEISQSFTELVQGQLFPQNIPSEKPKFHNFPVRFDLLIIPPDIENNESDAPNDTDDTDDSDESDDDGHDVGDIAERLSEYFNARPDCIGTLSMDPDSRVTYTAIRNVLTNWRNSQTPEIAFLRGRRYVTVVDRRRTEKVELYFFEVKKENYQLPSRHAEQWSLMNFCRSKEFLLPASSSDAAVGLYDRVPGIFCVSYDCYCADNIAAYFIFNGCQTRFYPCDVLSEWPRLFQAGYNQITIPVQSEWPMFTDVRLDEFCTRTTGEELNESIAVASEP